MSGFQGTDRFVIQRRLGSGSFGAVYEVFDRERQAMVALKLPHEASAHNLYLFKQEFRALADISHPNLACLYELHTEGRRWFYTMELVHGTHLLNYLRGKSGEQQLAGNHDDPTAKLLGSLESSERNTHGTGAPGAFGSPPWTNSDDALIQEPEPQVPLELPTPPHDFEEVRSALRQLVAGLEALHSMGKLHRDLKPSNVLMTENGRLVILDFGLVIDMESPGRSRSHEGLSAGTPAYMAPEQIKGHTASDASDWYSVGVMLYQSLTGRLPFPSNTHHQMVHKLNLDPVAPRLLLPVIPQDLDTLCVALLQRPPGLRPKGAQILAHLEASDSPDAVTAFWKPKLTVSSTVVRESELQVLLEHFQKTKQGTATTVFLHGESGMGKSFLAKHFLQEAKRIEPRALLLLGRCYEQESVPFKALDSLVDSLSQYLKQLGREEASSMLPRHIHALAKLFPVLNQNTETQEVPPETADIPDAQESRRRAFGALRELLGQICRKQPSILVIDDLQWGDLDSAALLKELLRLPDPPPAMFLLCYRSDEADTSPILRELLSPQEGSWGDSTEVRLDELPMAQARRLALASVDSSQPGASDMAERIAVESGGNPFFIGELARHYHQTGNVAPNNSQQSLEEYIRHRVAFMPSDSKRILETLAIAGYPLEWSILQRASSPGERGVSSLASLRVGHLIRIRNGVKRKMVETYHDRIREAIAKSVPPSVAIGIHHRIAQALEKASSPDTQALAYHFQESGEHSKAAYYSTIAGDQAMTALAFDRASMLYRKTLGLLDPACPEACSLWKRLGDSLTNAGRSLEAAEAYLQAASRAPADKTFRLQRRAAEEYLRGGKIESGLAILRQLLASVGTKLPARPRQALLSIVLHRILLRIRGLGFVERSQDQIPADELEKIDIFWAGAMGLGPVDILRGADFQTRQLLLTLAAGEPHRVVRALAHETIFVSSGGSRCLKKSRKLQSMTLALAERIGQPNPRARAIMAAGIAAMMQGRWHAATELLERAEGMFKQFCTGMDYELRIAQQQDLLAHSVLGDLLVVQTRLIALLQEARDKGDLLSITNLRTSLSYLPTLAKDDPDRARNELSAAMELWPKKDFHAQHFYALIARVNIELYSGEPWNAREILLRDWEALQHSLLLQVQTLRITAVELRARTALATLPETKDSRSRARLLREVSRDIRALCSEDVSYGEALALKLLGLKCALQDQTAEAVGFFIQAEVAFEACDMRLHTMAVRYRRGLLQGQSGGEAVASAEAWMRAQGIKLPSLFAIMHVPAHQERSRPGLQFPQGSKGVSFA